MTPEHAYVFQILEPILTQYPETRALYAPEGRMLTTGDLLRFPDLADALERLAAEGPEWLYRGETAQRICEWVTERGGLLSAEDFAAYEVIERQPVVAAYRGLEVLTNPPPSSGGILIAFALDLLERLGDPAPFDDPDALQLLVEVMAEAADARGADFHERLHHEGFAAEFLSPARLERAASQRGGAGGERPARRRGEPLGSTTHISTLDADGNAASVTCSNGTGSGVMAPGTGVHLNNMLGEEDLNPLGFHRLSPGTRVTSMMAPTIVLRDGEVELSLGSAGSNRLRSAILQVVRCVVRLRHGGRRGGARRPSPLRGRDAARGTGLQPGVAGRAGPPGLPRGALEGPEPLLRRRAGGARRDRGDGGDVGRRRPAPRRRGRRRRLDAS